MALRSDWQRQLKRAHDELGFRCVRFHGLLSDDIGTVLRDGRDLVYSFFNCDQIFDFLLTIGMKPFVELSFMPTPLASGKRTVFSYEANVTPPKDYKEWATLIQRLVSHWIDRYGESESKPSSCTFASTTRWNQPARAYNALMKITQTGSSCGRRWASRNT